ncbi:MAG: peptidylprolyl isomerase [Desulfotalea sp.]|nr:MAG: peptidylprolyl isomerase [Desulfotalea sp.]
MAKIQTGDKVSVHYIGKLGDGSIFDSTVGEDPFVFTFGEDDLIDGFVNAILTMEIGDKKTVTVDVEEAYGEWHEDMLIEVPRSEMPEELTELAVGDELEVTDEEEEPMLVIVSELTDTTVTLDGNPPLAGEALTFELELVAVG